MSDTYHLRCYDHDEYICIGQSGGTIYSRAAEPLLRFLRKHQGCFMRFEWSGEIGDYGEEFE
jgi:hypothetical protein